MPRAGRAPASRSAAGRCRASCSSLSASGRSCRPAARSRWPPSLLALAALAAVLLPPALETASENRANTRRAEAANLEAIRQQVTEDQRPRRAVVAVPVSAAGVAAVVAADFERRVRAGQLEGPGGPTTCRPIRPQREREAIGFTCLAERGEERGAYQDRDLVSGYRFRARVERATGAAAWCKENPQPLHADQEEFVVVPLSRACTG